jgi:hypothetical protein
MALDLARRICNSTMDCQVLLKGDVAKAALASRPHVPWKVDVSDLATVLAKVL